MRIYDGLVEVPAETDVSAGMHVPTRPEELAAHYDLTISHPTVRMETFAAFDRYLAEAAAEYDLTCGLIHDGVVQEALRRLAAGRLTIGFHLDYFALWHIPDDPYARLAAAVEDSGGRPVNTPGRARAFTDKAEAHGELLRRGLGVPPTVVLRPWAEDRPLTVRERELLRLDEPGARVYLKPANGFGARGVVRVERTDPEGLEASLAAARQFDRQDSFLIQREVCPPLLACEDGAARPAYWRVICCLGEWSVFWWQHQDRMAGRPSYRPVTPAEMRRHRLHPVLDYGRAQAELSGLEWFSTELCLGDGPQTSRFMVVGSDGRPRPVLAIDYFNDQCDVDVQSRWPGGPPDSAVRRFAERIAEAAWRARCGSVRPGAMAPWGAAA
jgi:hypothetical protein